MLSCTKSDSPLGAGVCVTVMDEVLSPAMFPAITRKVWISPGNSPGRVTEVEGTVLTCSREDEKFNGSISNTLR